LRHNKFDILRLTMTPYLGFSQVVWHASKICIGHPPASNVAWKWCSFWNVLVWYTCTTNILWPTSFGDKTVKLFLVILQHDYVGDWMNKFCNWPLIVFWKFSLKIKFRIGYKPHFHYQNLQHCGQNFYFGKTIFEQYIDRCFAKINIPGLPLI